MIKVACLLSKGEGEGYHSKIKSSVEKFIPKLHDYELTYDEWGDPDEVAFRSILLDIEKKGPDTVDIPGEFFANYKDCDFVMGTFTPFARKSIEQLTGTRVIGTMRAGLENVDVKACTDHGIAVVNAAGRNADAVSDFAVAMLLSESRNIARSYNMMKNGTWATKFPNSKAIPDMREKTVGLVGFGQIGSRVAEKLSGFHMNIICYDPYVSEEFAAKYNTKLVSKEELFRTSDFVSVHARLTPDTHHMIGKEDIALMKPTAVFINTARSGLVDYDALLEALQNKKIAGAALDVFDQEPLPQDSPWLQLDNVTLTPHIAGQTKDSGDNTVRLLVDGFYNLVVNGDNSRVVNKEVTETAEFKAWMAEAKAKMGF